MDQFKDFHFSTFCCLKTILIVDSVPNGDENQPANAKSLHQSAVIDETVQKMTHGFVTLFEKELDQVQYSLKEALYVE